MPAAIPTREQIANYAPAIAEALIGSSGVLNGVLALPFTFATADATVMYTVPAGYRMRIRDAAWEVAVAFTGGATPAIGLKSSNAGYATAGDLLGGAGGELTAGLTVVAATPIRRTIGAKIAAGVWLLAGDTIIFNRMVSAFTAGSGTIHIEYALYPAS